MATTTSILSPRGPERTLSADVFFHVLMYIGTKEEDMTFLWTTCREVSRDFKDAVERVFIARHLKKTYLRVDAGWAYSEKHGKVSLATEFSFSHLDPTNRNRAIFRDEECHDDFKPLMKLHLKAHLEYGNPVHRPKIIVQIRHFANDTPIPGLELNLDELEMSVDWMGMYSEWFREEKDHHKYMGKLMDGADGLEAMAIGMRQKVENGEMDLMKSFEMAIKAFAGGYEDAWQKTRAERIKRNVRAEGGSEIWDDSDRAGYRRLKDIRFAVSLEDSNSDSEDENDERDVQRDGASEEEEEEYDDEEYDEEYESDEGSAQGDEGEAGEDGKGPQ
ncbi:hypothetical protein V5O48_017646 [Marasmius crinis-equi]|uniref:Uncharacterized protein n=1 Tax=Marasmius crinis-equi TaxID=585013 RepID=A0ABR3END0_9AGAR